MEAANHIVKSLAVSKNAADDMMRILSNYDTRMFPLSSPVTGEAAGEVYGCGEGEEEEEEAFAAAEDFIRRCNSSTSSSGMTDYLYAVDDAIAAAALQGDLASRAAAAVQAAMPRLGEEVRALLCSSVRRLSLSSDDLDDATPDASPRPDAFSPHADASVRGIADRMLRAGYGPELAQVYVVVRSDALAKSVARLTALRPSPSRRCSRWSGRFLTRRCGGGAAPSGPWLRPSSPTSGSSATRSSRRTRSSATSASVDVARVYVMQLFDFVNAVAMSAHATEELYRMLGM